MELVNMARMRPNHAYEDYLNTVCTFSFVLAGFSPFYYTTKGGRRWGAYHAYLEKIRETRKDRLTIYKYAFVTKVRENPHVNFTSM
jgi:hypothetical protein